MFPQRNTLYYGDNLNILRQYIPDESVDLVYLDPPFNSNRNYNVLFKNERGEASPAQVQAFVDTWHWGESAEQAYHDLTTRSTTEIATVVSALRQILGTSQMMAYLVMMGVRLVELHRVLKSTGSIYLHCDPTASHYLKILLDMIFGPSQFSNEIIWRRTGSHNNTQRFAPIHDVILFYTKTDSYTWNKPKRPYMKGHVQKSFVKDEYGYRTNYSGNILSGSGTRNGESGLPRRGFKPTKRVGIGLYQGHW